MSADNVERLISQLRDVASADKSSKWRQVWMFVIGNERNEYKARKIDLIESV